LATKTLVTTFDRVREAERAVQKLQQDGFADEDVGWVSRAADGGEIAHGNLVIHHKGSTARGLAVGGALGGLAGLLIGATVLTVGGVAGPLVIIGPLVSTALGAGLGAAVGGRVERYGHPDVPREQAHRYGARLGANAAAVMVTVSDEEEEGRALEILRSEAGLHRHEFRWRVPALMDEGRPSKPSLPGW